MAKAKLRPELTLRVTLENGLRLGPGKILLLEEIERLGSISAAGRAMNMSYKRAWDLVQESNCLFELAVVERKTGGKSGGGATVTPFGRELIAAYRRAESVAEKAIDVALQKLKTQRMKYSRSPH